MFTRSFNLKRHFLGYHSKEKRCKNATPLLIEIISILIIAITIPSTVLNVENNFRTRKHITDSLNKPKKKPMLSKPQYILSSRDIDDFIEELRETEINDYLL